MSEDQTTTQDTKDSFDAAVRELRDSGFKRTDLSVLSSHESIDVAGSDGRSWGDVLTALVGEVKYEVPLVASGAIALFGGAATAPERHHKTRSCRGPGGNCGGGRCWGGGPARIYWRSDIDPAYR